MSNTVWCATLSLARRVYYHWIREFSRSCSVEVSPRIWRLWKASRQILVLVHLDLELSNPSGTAWLSIARMVFTFLSRLRVTEFGVGLHQFLVALNYYSVFLCYSPPYSITGHSESTTFSSTKL